VGTFGEIRIRVLFRKLIDALKRDLIFLLIMVSFFIYFDAQIHRLNNKVVTGIETLKNLIENNKLDSVKISP
jgi:hypothetical protein